MIIHKYIKIEIIQKHLVFYTKMGYDIKIGDIISIMQNQLHSKSNVKIDVVCDICERETYISNRSYNINVKKNGSYSCPKCGAKKHQELCIEKYGVKSYTQTEEYIIKTRKTKLERYGDEKYVNMEKQKQTNLERYGSESYMGTTDFKDKSNITMLEKYDTLVPLRNDNIKEKWIKTNNEKYGTDYVLLNDGIKEKISETKLELYGDINFNNRDKFKETCIELYGFDNPMKNSEYCQRFFDDFFSKHGERHPMHVKEFSNKCINNGLKNKKYKDTDIYYQSTYENDFLEKYYDIINVVRGEAIKYNFNESVHVYYPDFFISELNLIVEIKSSYWYEKQKDKNDTKRQSCIDNGFDFMFIINKDYTLFDSLIKTIQ